jgi:hypothetical protein
MQQAINENVIDSRTGVTVAAVLALVPTRPATLRVRLLQSPEVQKHTERAHEELEPEHCAKRRRRDRDCGEFFYFSFSQWARGYSADNLKSLRSFDFLM